MENISFESVNIKNNPRFTVFTPTFNRKHTIKRVFDSLLVQTYKDFEWLVIDDGSNDDTYSQVLKWSKEAWFPIRYYYQSNKGKHIAFNYAVKVAKGEFFLTFDSDDSCFPDALEKLYYYWNAIPNDLKSKFTGVTGLCVDINYKIIGNKFPADIFDSNSIDISMKYNILGEKWGFHKLSVLREFPFPEIDGEKFLIESIVWNRIAKKYMTRFINETLRIYEDTENGLSRRITEIRIKNPRGTRLFYQECIDLNTTFVWKIKNVINYIRFSLHGKVSISRIILDSKVKMLTIILIIFGYMFYKFDKKHI